MEYALKAKVPYNNHQKTIKADHHDKVSRFVDTCGEKWHTKTIYEESKFAIIKAVNSLVDERLKKKKGTNILRRVMILTATKQLEDLFKISELKNTGNVDVNPVHEFYEKVVNSTAIRSEELRLRKHRDNIYPEPNDMKILAEASELVRLSNLRLISGDGHFTSYKDEIFNEFGIEVLDFYDLRKYV